MALEMGSCDESTKGEVVEYLLWVSGYTEQGDLGLNIDDMYRIVKGMMITVTREWQRLMTRCECALMMGGWFRNERSDGCVWITPEIIRSTCLISDTVLVARTARVEDCFSVVSLVPEEIIYSWLSEYRRRRYWPVVSGGAWREMGRTSPSEWSILLTEVGGFNEISKQWKVFSRGGGC